MPPPLTENCEKTKSMCLEYLEQKEINQGKEASILKKEICIRMRFKILQESLEALTTNRKQLSKARSI